jgi:hypothetical protein
MIDSTASLAVERDWRAQVEGRSARDCAGDLFPRPCERAGGAGATTGIEGSGLERVRRGWGVFCFRFATESAQPSAALGGGAFFLAISPGKTPHPADTALNARSPVLSAFAALAA